MEFSMDLAGAIAAFVVAVGILVAVHEFGHFWVARRLGVRVLRFSIGFGRSIWTRRGADGTEYAIGILPLGGYVKMLDEQDADVPEADRERAFNRKPLWARSAIVLAGPAFNFLFAVFAWWLVYMVGFAGLKAVVGEVTPGLLAERAGLGTGDAVVAVEGREATTWSAVVVAILGEALDQDRVELQWMAPDRGIESGSLDLRGVNLDGLTSGSFFATLGIEPAVPASPPVIGAVNEGEAADRAGMRPGDVVVRALGQPIGSWTEWVRFVRERPEVEFPVEVRRGVEIVTLAMRPAAVEHGGETIGRIGAVLDQDAMLTKGLVRDRTAHPLGGGRARDGPDMGDHLPHGGPPVEDDPPGALVRAPERTHHDRPLCARLRERRIHSISRVPGHRQRQPRHPQPPADPRPGRRTPAHPACGGAQGWSVVSTHDVPRLPGGSGPARWTDGPGSLQ